MRWLVLALLLAGCAEVDPEPVEVAEDVAPEATTLYLHTNRTDNLWLDRDPDYPMAAVWGVIIDQPHTWTYEVRDTVPLAVAGIDYAIHVEYPNRIQGDPVVEVALLVDGAAVRTATGTEGTWEQPLELPNGTAVALSVTMTFDETPANYEYQVIGDTDSWLRLRP